MEEIIKYLGNFHPVILHLPIGAFLFTLLLFIYGKFSKIELTIPFQRFRSSAVEAHAGAVRH